MPTDDRLKQVTTRQIIWLATIAAAIVAGALTHEARLASALDRQAAQIAASIETRLQVHTAVPHPGAATLVHNHQQNATAHSALFSRIEKRLEDLRKGQETLLSRSSPRRRGRK